MALVPPIGLVLFLTVSRGAHLAAIAGLVVLVLLARNRRALDTSLMGLALVTLMAGLAARFPGVVELHGSEGARQREALAVLALMLLLSAVGAGCQALLIRLEARGETWTGALRKRPAAAALAGLAALAVLAVGVAAFTGGQVSASPDQKGPERFRTLETNRWEYWDVALDTFAERPLAGSGVHGFAADWFEHRDIDEAVQDAHSLYIETLTELGLPGLALLLCSWAPRAWRSCAQASRAGPLPQRSGRFTPRWTGTGRCPRSRSSSSSSPPPPREWRRAPPPPARTAPARPRSGSA